MGGQFDIGIPEKRRQITHNFVLSGTGKSWVGFQLAQLPGPTPNAPLDPHWDPNYTPSKYSQAVADGATLVIVRRCEVTVVADASKYSVNSHMSAGLLKFVQHSPTICGLFLFWYRSNVKIERRIPGENNVNDFCGLITGVSIVQQKLPLPISPTLGSHNRRWQ